MTIRVVDKLWFTPCQMSGDRRKVTLGIIICEDDVTRDRKAYIGIGDGICEDIDTKRILEWGAKLHKIVVRNLIDQLDTKMPRKRLLRGR